jgi:hypothetical protein
MIDEITENTILSRYLCPNLCQCLIYMNKICDKCGEKLEFIGDFDEKDLDIELGKRQLSKFMK